MSVDRRGAFYHNGEGHGRPLSEMEPSHETSLQKTLRWLHMQHDGENPAEPGQVTRRDIEQAIHGQSSHLESSASYHSNERSHPSSGRRGGLTDNLDKRTFSTQKSSRQK